MPRTITVPANDYAAGVYGPYEVNGLASSNTDAVNISFSVESWPTHNSLISGSIRWNTGDGVDFVIASPPIDRFGQPLAKAIVRVDVPRLPSGKTAVNKATATLTAAAPLRTAITFSALAP